VMDQKKVRGIGNSYADEILWDAKLSPFSIASAIPKPKVKKLYESLGSLLKEAIQVISRENGDELHGKLRDAMKVHGAQIKKSPTEAVIKSEKIGGRIAYYTDEQVVHN
ncbi:MAG: formamidopyrimidine-DNA glycosylase, partial [Chitinophagaceae bacterium]